MNRKWWYTVVLAPAVMGLGGPSPAVAAGSGAAGNPTVTASPTDRTQRRPVVATPVPPAPPSVPAPARPSVPVVGRPVPPVPPDADARRQVNRRRPFRLPPRRGTLGQTAGSCSGPSNAYYGLKYPPETPPEHGALLGLDLYAGYPANTDIGKTGQDTIYWATVVNGAVNHTNCQAVNDEVAIALPLGQGPWFDWMVVGPHTVVQFNAYPTGSSPPFSGQPSFSGYFGPGPVITDPFSFSDLQNPLYVDVAPNVRLADVWNTTGEIVILDTLDFLTRYGTCNSYCDISGYTVHDQTLRQSDGGLANIVAPNATFRNVTFEGMQLQGANFRNAVFDNVIMDSPNLANADFSGAQFMGTTISNANLSGANLKGAVFQNATLDHLSGSGADFSSAQLIGTTMPSATISGADFSSAQLIGTTMPSATISDTKFNGAVLQNVTLSHPVLTGDDFGGAQFLGTNSLSSFPDVSGTNFAGTFFSADTSIIDLHIGASGSTCTSFATDNLLAPTIVIQSSDQCARTQPVFNGAQVRASIAFIQVWQQWDWSGATVVWDAADRTYWRQQDLSKINLSQVRMVGVPADLTGTNFSGANLTGSAALRGMNLTSAILSGVQAQNATFDGANLTGALLNQPQGMTTMLNGASFQKATLDGASFSGSSIVGANFSHASAHGPTNFNNTKAAGVIFDGAHVLGNPSAFEGAVFDSDPNTTAGDASFVGTILGGNVSAGDGINFEKTHLRNAHFNNAQCIGCIFSGTDLTGANFNAAYLFGSVFSGASLTSAVFTSVQMSTISGTWTFQLGVSEAPTAVSYNPTDFSGAAFTTVAACPDGQRPDTFGCLNHLDPAAPAPPIPAVCSAAGEDTCPLPVTTVTGTGSAGTGATQVNNPAAVVVAGNGDLYFADTANHVVRKVSANGVATFAGQLGIGGDSGDGGSASGALLQAPVGLALGADDPPTVYISDRGANRVRKVTQKTDSQGTIQTTISGLAGTGQACASATSACGDGGDPLQAQLSGPEAVWADPLGNVYIADTQANKIRLAVAHGPMKTVAGNGTPGYAGDGGSASSAMLSGPAGLTGDVYGSLFVADTDNNRIRKIDTNGTIGTVFGNGTPGYNGSYAQDPITFQWTYPKQGTTAELNHPRGLAMNTSTGLFVADTGNGIVRRLNTSSGAIALIAGKTKESGNSSTVDTSYNGDGLPANQTGFSQPTGVAVTDTGTYRVTDTGHQRLRSFGPWSTH